MSSQDFDFGDKAENAMIVWSGQIEAAREDQNTWPENGFGRSC